MELNRNKILFLILPICLFMNIAIFFGMQKMFLANVLVIFSLFTIPGFLILLSLKVSKIEFWEYLVLMIGLSVSSLILVGLLTNWVFPALHITNAPLSTKPLMIVYNSMLLFLGIPAYIRSRTFNVKTKFSKITWTSMFLFITPVIFLATSIFGGILLNNGGSNILSLLLLIGIAIFVIGLTLFGGKMSKNIYPWSVLLIGISLLLVFSLRSWHVSGWDINQEYYVFQLAKQQMLWDINSFRNAYNACLSITILPIVLSTFTGIKSELIFKVIFPIIFSITPVAIYLISKKYIARNLAFLASFFFMSQWMFINQYPSIAREMIGLTFLSLFVLVLFSKNIRYEKRQLLVFIFGLSIIFSHYTLAYFLLFIIVGLNFTIYFIKKIKERTKYFKKINICPRIDNKVVLILLFATFIWNVKITNTADNLTSFFSNEQFTFKNIFLSRPAPSSQLLLERYASAPKNAEENIKLELNLYSSQSTNQYNANVVDKTFQPVLNQAAWNFSRYLFVIITALSFIFLFVGSFCLLYLIMVGREMFNIEYAIISFLYLFLLAVTVIVPNSANSISPLRVFQESLLLLSPVYVVGSLFLFDFLKHKWRLSLVTIVFVLYFLFYSTFMQSLLGGKPFTAETYSLGNEGSYYDFYYTHDSEVMSATWFLMNYDHRSNVFADEVASFRLLSFGKITNINYDIMPTSIDKGAYVYLDYRNSIKEKAFVWYQDRYYLNYNYPKNFLEKNKSLIYSNGESQIFK